MGDEEGQTLTPLVPEPVVDDQIEKRRPAALGRFGDGRCDLVGVRDPKRGHSHRASEPDEVDRRVPELHAGVSLDAVKRLQSFLDDAVAAVVGDDVGDRQLGVCGGP